MKQLNMRLDDQIAEAFYRFCERLGMKPTTLLGSIVDFYGRSEILAQKAESGQIDRQGMLVELGKIVADMQKLSRANGEVKTAIGDLLQPYGIRIDELRLI